MARSRQTVAPEFASIESFIQFMLDEDRTQYTKLEMQELGTSLQKTDMWVSQELRSWGLSIVTQVPVKHTRGFTTSSNDRWFGPGSSPCHGGSGADQINGFAGSAHSAAANTTFGELARKSSGPLSYETEKSHNRKVKKMNVELKKIKHSKSLSHETQAYSAEIWVDGILRGSVENSGQGGPDNVRPNALYDSLSGHVKTLPPIRAYGTEFAATIDTFLGSLLQDFLMEKDFRGILKRKTVFVGSDGKLYQMKAPHRPSNAAKVLNDVPFEEALSTYKTLTA